MRPAFGAARNRFREVNVNVETVGNYWVEKSSTILKPEFSKMHAPFV